eukprot:gene56562-19419_t
MRGIRKAAVIFLASQYMQEIELLLPGLLIHRLIETPTVVTMQLGKGEEMRATKVLRVVLHCVGSALPSGFQASVLADAVR